MRLLSSLPLLVLVLACASPAAAQGLFVEADVERMKAFYQDNARNGSLDCLETMNKGMRTLYASPGMRLGSTVDRTMAALQASGRAGDTVQFDFFDEEGKPTSGVTEPKTLRESVWEGLLARIGEAKGWSLFGLSPLDGNHSVVLAVDTRGERPQVFWCDQWSSKGGWKLYPDREALDGEIERLTASWWRSKLSSLKIKFKTRCRLYPLVPTPAERWTAVVHRASHLNLRAGPSKDEESLLLAESGDTFAMLGREGKWVRVRLPDGREAYGHGWFLQVSEASELEPSSGAGSSLSEALEVSGAPGEGEEPSGTETVARAPVEE